MERRALGTTGLELSVLGLGGWQLAGPVTVEGQPDGFPDPGERASVDLIRCAADLGFDWIDTAPSYGAGEGERRVGRAIRVDRDRWTLCTKFGLACTPDGRLRTDVRPAAIGPSLEASLKRLGTDRVEILLYHAPANPAELAAGAEVLDRLREAGKLRCWGVSTHDAACAAAALEAGAQVLQAPQSLHRPAGEFTALAAAKGVGMLVRGSLERGSLVARRDSYASDDIRSREPLADLSCYTRLRPQGVSPTAFALRHVLDQSTTVSVLVGARTSQQLESACQVLDTPPLDAHTERRIERVRRRLHAVARAHRAVAVVRSRCSRFIR